MEQLLDDEIPTVVEPMVIPGCPPSNTAGNRALRLRYVRNYPVSQLLGRMWSQVAFVEKSTIIDTTVGSIFIDNIAEGINTIIANITHPKT
jgi:hypothetical protein